MSSWQIYCNTENTFVTATGAYPTTCPNNIAHSVNLSSVIPQQFIIGEVGDAGATGLNAPLAGVSLATGVQYGTYTIDSRGFKTNVAGFQQYPLPYINAEFPVVIYSASTGTMRITDPRTNGFTYQHVINQNSLNVSSVVQSNTGSMQNSLLNMNGVLGLFYIDNLDGHTKLTVSTGGSTWSSPIILATGEVQPREFFTYYNTSYNRWLSTELVNGYPSLLYNDHMGNVKFMMAKDYFGSQWNTARLLPLTALASPTGSVGPGPAIMTVGGNPAVGYFGDGNQLVYARALDSTGFNWGTGMVEMITNGSYSNPVIVGNNPAFLDKGQYFMRANDSFGSSWSSTGVQILDGTATSFSLSTISGNPAIAYQDNQNSFTKYLRALDSTGLVWSTNIPKTLGTGTNTSIRIVNGNPAMIYTSPGSSLGIYRSLSGLYYVRANDNTGGSWGDPVFIDGGPSLSWQSFEIVNGNPAVAYQDSTFSDLRYARAKDANGSSWEVPIIVTSTGTVGAYASMKVVDGNPAIAFQNQNLPGISFVRSLNPSGTGWGGLQTILSGLTYQHTSLQIVNGNPAISTYDPSNGKLRYVRATTSTGSVWGTTITPNASADVAGLYNSLAVINGNPAVSYFNSTQNILQYQRSTDNTGGIWTTAVFVDTGSTGYSYPQLMTVGGNPAVLYNRINEYIKFIRSSDVNGVGWASTLSRIVGFVSTGVDNVIGMDIVNGNPAAVWNGKYLRAQDTTGGVWTTNPPIAISAVPLSGEINTGCFLETINGVPAVSYGSNFNSYFAIARNATGGGSWNTPVTTIAASTLGLNVAKPWGLKNVSGAPAIVIGGINGSNQYTLYYQRASTSTGSTWGSQVLLGNFTSEAPSSFLEIANGRPAFVYGNNTVGSGRAFVGNDAIGSSFTTTTIATGTYNALHVVNGSPYVTFMERGQTRIMRGLDTLLSSFTIPTGVDNKYYSGFRYLTTATGNIGFFGGKFLRSNDVTGSSWNVPSIVIPTVDTGIYSASFATINGTPAVSYASTITSLAGATGIKYSRSLNATGTSWDSTGIILGTGTSLQVLGLQEMSGKPTILYYGLSTSTGTTLAKSNDTTGSTWTTYYAGPSSNGKYKIINGYPYYVSNNTSVYIAANTSYDASGTNWPQTLSNIEYIGTLSQNPLYFSFTEFQNNAAVSFFNTDGGSIDVAIDNIRPTVDFISMN